MAADDPPADVDPFLLGMCSLTIVAIILGLEEEENAARNQVRMAATAAALAAMTYQAMESDDEEESPRKRRRYRQWDHQRAAEKA